MLVRSWILRNSDACLEEFKWIWLLGRTCNEADDICTLQPISCIASGTSQRTLKSSRKHMHHNVHSSTVCSLKKQHFKMFIHRKMYE